MELGAHRAKRRIAESQSLTVEREIELRRFQCSLAMGFNSQRPLDAAPRREVVNLAEIKHGMTDRNLIAPAGHIELAFSADRPRGSGNRELCRNRFIGGAKLRYNTANRLAPQRGVSQFQRGLAHRIIDGALNGGISGKCAGDGRRYAGKLFQIRSRNLRRLQLRSD